MAGKDSFGFSVGQAVELRLGIIFYGRTRGLKNKTRGFDLSQKSAALRGSHPEFMATRVIRHGAQWQQRSIRAGSMVILSVCLAFRAVPF